MSQYFFIDAVTRRESVEPKWLKYVRVAGALICIGYIAFILTDAIEDIITKEIDVSDTHSSVLLPNKKVQPLWPNARICLIGDEANLVADKVQFTVTCTLTDQNATNNGPCPGFFTPLRGYSEYDTDYNISWGTKGRVYQPYWKDGYCFHYSSLGLESRDLTKPIRFDLQTTPALQPSTFPNNDAYFDILFYDPRNDPMAVLYNITQETRTNKGIEYYNTFIEEFVDNDESQQNNEYFLSLDQSTRVRFVPVFSKRIRDNGWNYIGILPQRDDYYELNSQRVPATVLTPNYQATIELLSNVPEDSQPVIKVETRKYSISTALQALYVLYVFAGNLYFHFFGARDTQNPFGYFNAFVDYITPEQKEKMNKDYGKGETLPFSNLDIEKPNPSPHDNDAISRRLLNLETVLAEYYIDVNKFKKRKKVVRYPRSMKERVLKFGKNVYQYEVKKKEGDDDEEVGEDIDLGEVSIKE